MKTSIFKSSILLIMILIINFSCTTSDQVISINYQEQNNPIQSMERRQGKEVFERGLTLPTGWKWYTNTSEENIKNQHKNGYRPFDIEVVNTSPYRFAVTMVKNSGSYYRNKYWWYYGKSSSEIKKLISENKARIIDIEVYWVGDQKKYAVIMVDNKGSNNRKWWYYSQITYKGLKDSISNKKGRLIDIDTYIRNGKRYYSVVMIQNSGNESKAWWWYTGITRDELKAKLREHNARIVDIEHHSTNRFTVILERNNSIHWSWFYGVDYNEVKRLIGNWGARIADIERYTISGKTKYAILLLNNSNEVETKVGDVIRPGLEDNKGFYGMHLRRINSSSDLAKRRKNFAFYPASTNKVIHHLYIMRKVDDKTFDLSDNVIWYSNSDESCEDNHTGHTISNDPLRNCLRMMMENSNNQTTNAIQEFAGGGNAALGRSRILSMAWNTVLMSTKTRLHHKFGCDGASSNPPNRSTLEDLTLLYDKVASGTMFSNNNTRNDFYTLMKNSQGSFINNVIDQEVPPGVNVNKFKNELYVAWKGGSVTGHKSLAGWIRIPTRTGSREYVFALFIEYGDGLFKGASELLRKEIRLALNTF